MTAWKRRRENPCTPEALAAIEWTLPAELLLEIVARSDTRTLVRGAATCKLLRRDILSPSFLRSVTQEGGIVPPWILAHVNTHDVVDDPPTPLSLVHPATPAALSFSNDHMSPYMSPFADDLLGEHYAVTSRGGLVLLRPRHVCDRLSDLCVYEPFTGHRMFLNNPPGIGSNNLEECFNRCVLLTAADGIECSFLLLVPHLVTRPNINNINTKTLEVHIARSPCGTWAPAIKSRKKSDFILHQWSAMCRGTAVLHVSVIHRFVRHHGVIITYNICTKELQTTKLRIHVTKFKGRLHLGSYDGRNLLRLLGIDGFNISVWHQLPNGDWPSEAMMINMEEKLRSLEPDIITGRLVLSKFMCSGEGSSAVLLLMYRCGSGPSHHLLITLDLETKEIRMQQYSTPPSVLLEVHLPSRLRSMKIFP